MTKDPKKVKRDIDWEAIQREYRAGILSEREVAQIHGVSHTAIQKRKKKNPKLWQRDLSARVREAVARKTVADEVASVDEEGIVDEASDRAIAVIRQHRTTITKLATIESTFAEELQGLQKKKLEKDEKPVALSTKVTTLLALVTASEKRVKMERQAFGITDNVKPEEDGSAKITITFVEPGT